MPTTGKLTADVALVVVKLAGGLGPVKEYDWTEGGPEPVLVIVKLLQTFEVVKPVVGVGKT